MLIKVKAQLKPGTRFFDGANMDTVYINPMQVTTIQECNAKACYVGLVGAYVTFLVEGSADLVAGKINAELEEMP